MTDFERNIRTLLVCFVIALGVLVPLRFAEINNQMQLTEDPQVLGVNCFGEKEINQTIKEINEKILNEKLSEEKLMGLSRMVEEMKENQCF